MKPGPDFQPPSKKILILVGVILLFFVVLFGYTPLMNAYKNGQFKGSLSYTTETENTTDTDNDGLKDWEENIWKTDPHNQDSDNDGTSDGEEVSVGRDPNKAGPDDTIDSLAQVISLTNSSQFSNDPDNLSQQLAQQIFTKSISTGNTDQLDENSEAEIVASTLGTFQGKTISPHYTLNDIKQLSPIESKNKVLIKDFGTAVVTIQDPLFNLPETSSDPEILKVYGNIVSGLAGLKVPQELASQYLDLLNNFYIMEQLYTRITTEYEDPVKVYLDTKSFQDITVKNRDIYKQFATYFRNNGIIWSTNEAGDVWNSY